MDTLLNWHTYQDVEYGYTIKYPDIYILSGLHSTLGSESLVRQVRILDRSIAQSDTADLEVAEITVEVYINSGNLTLKEWLDVHGEVGDRNPVDIRNQRGIRLTLMTLAAPNEFFYFSSERYIYKITLLGQYSEQILQSFQLAD